jgi:hypothetical protein
VREWLYAPSDNDLTPRCTRRVASREPRNLFLELIDPFPERAKCEFPNMLAGGSILLGFDVELFQFLEFQTGVLKLILIVDAHEMTSTMRITPA